MVIVVVLDALGTEWFDAGRSWAEVGIGFTIVFQAGIFNKFGGKFRSIQIGVVTILHLNLTIIFEDE